MNVKSGNGINKLPIFPLVSDCWCFLLRMAVPCLAGGLWRHNSFQLTCRTLTSTFKPTPLFPSAHFLSRCKPLQSSFYCSVPRFLNASSSLCPSRSVGLLPPTRSSSTQDGVNSNPVEKKDRIVTIPNLLCVSRIVAAPYIAYCIASADYATAAALFVYAGATDMADGAIARRYVHQFMVSKSKLCLRFPSQASSLGSFLDPLSDKILVGIVYLALTYAGQIPASLTGLIVSR